MTMYYWAESLDDYAADNEADYDKIIEIKRLNFFIGRNNAGKSRFLRELFKNKFDVKDYTFINKFDVKNVLIELNRIAHYNSNIILPKKINQQISSDDAHHFLEEQINKLTQPFFLINANEENILKVYEYLMNSSYSTNSMNSYTRVFSEEYFKEILEHIEFVRKEVSSILRKKYYTPTLRGMRPTSDQKSSTPYIDRTIKDYFTNNDKKIASSTDIISGECLFYELTRCLLGEPHERQIIREYEQKLSQYFFDNQTISLIPKHNSDVVYIKIGEDQQFPIYQLGDGLQQAIILTYEAFIKKDDVHAFFIEEPELHMHAGMVRQLMNFYLNETKHYYFFTTHSNHLLDMVDESDEVMIQKFSKTEDGKFLINRCDKDRDLLASLGVKPSSVYLANCTIWMEGITDRLYITKYIQKYLADLKTSNIKLYKQYLRFMPNYHYTFVEYAGSNLTHWCFSEHYPDQIEDNGLSAKAVASEMLLIADGDVQNKGNRVNELIQQLTQENFLLLGCKEIENTLPDNIIIATARDKFSRMQADTTHGFDISVLDSIPGKLSFYHSKNGIGKILDNNIRLPNGKGNYCFSDKSGTIKEKLKFCRLILSMMDTQDWELTESAKKICEKIFNHIEKCN